MINSEYGLDVLNIAPQAEFPDDGGHAPLYLLIREHVITYEVLPEHRLDHRALKARFGVSTPQIREVCQILTSEGFLTHHPSRGFFVRPITVEQISDCYDWMLVVVRQAIAAHARSAISSAHEVSLPDIAIAGFAASGEAVQAVAAFEEGLLENIVATMRSCVGSRFFRLLLDRTYFLRRLALQDLDYLKEEYGDFLNLRTAFLAGDPVNATVFAESIVQRIRARAPDLVMTVKAMGLRAGIDKTEPRQPNSA